MPKPHVPNLDLIPNLDDEVRFYATIGVIISMWGAFEQTLFRFFEKASGMPHDLAASVYYQVRSDEARNDMTNQAMLHKLAGRAELTKWKDLSRRLSASAETSRFRNLVAHNPALRDITVHVTPGIYRLDLESNRYVQLPSPEARPHEVRHFVRQDPVQVATGKRKHYEADITKLREICAELERLHSDLDDFFETL